MAAGKDEIFSDIFLPVTDRYLSDYSSAGALAMNGINNKACVP